MQHAIPIDTLGPAGDAMAHAVDSCVHCGFCLSACPTYRVMGEETDSPRGRIYLMKEELEGALTLSEVAPYVDRCLGCMACVTACPSGVAYGELLTPFRERLEAARSRPLQEKLTRVMVRQVMPYPRRFRIAAQLGKLARGLKAWIPGERGAMLGLLPAQLEAAQPLEPIYAAEGERRARVALLSGCVQQVLSPQINLATIRVLTRNGVEVVVPPAQGCCGSLAMHTGEAATARSLARRNLALFPDDVDAIVTNAAGCGSGMHEYGLLFKGSEDEAAARAFGARVVDVTVFLDALGLIPPPAAKTSTRVAYHDACHLAHAQGVTAPPRHLLAAIPGVELVEIAEAELCCGSAGTYTLEQPQLAAQIGERKARNILATGAEVVATGNIGCLMQIQSHLEILGQSLPIRHTMDLLDRAYRGVDL